MRTAIGNLAKGGIAVARGPGTETFVIQDARNKVTNIGFVIDNQNVTGHGLHLSCQLPVSA
jgi:lipoate-protein ligase B